VRVNVERLPGSTVAVDIFADEAEFKTAYEAAARKINREITLPGFRKGKAPRQILERMVGREAIVAEAGQEMMDDLFKRAIEQENLVPVGEPKVELLQPEPLGFKVVVEVFPSATLGDYASVRVEPREVEIEDADVDTVLEQLQSTHAIWNELETPRQPREGDQVVLDLKVYEEDEVFQESSDTTFIIGESALFDAIQEAIKMMMPGSTAELTLSFEEDDETVAPEVRGKVLRYEITLKAVQERELPPIDDDLARKAGDYESLDALKEQIHKDLLRNKAVEARGEVVTEVINAMAETSEVDIPSTMIEKEIDDELTQFRSRLAQQRLSLDEYLAANDQSIEALRDEIRPNAQRRVRNSIVLQEIAKAEGIEVTGEDIADEIERLTRPAENPERLRALYESEYFRGLLENEMYDRKLTNRLVEIATEGRGAVTGAGAEALKAELEPPAPVERASEDGAIEETTAAPSNALDVSPDEADAALDGEASSQPSAEEALMDASREGEAHETRPEQAATDSGPSAEESLMDGAGDQSATLEYGIEPAGSEEDDRPVAVNET
jgi:trigger factor